MAMSLDCRKELLFAVADDENDASEHILRIQTKKIVVTTKMANCVLYLTIFTWQTLSRWLKLGKNRTMILSVQRCRVVKIT